MIFLNGLLAAMGLNENSHDSAKTGVRASISVPRNGTALLAVALLVMTVPGVQANPVESNLPPPPEVNPEGAIESSFEDAIEFAKTCRQRNFEMDQGNGEDRDIVIGSFALGECDSNKWCYYPQGYCVATVCYVDAEALVFQLKDDLWDGGPYFEDGISTKQDCQRVSGIGITYDP